MSRTHYSLPQVKPLLTKLLEWVKHNSLETALKFHKTHSGTSMSSLRVLDLASGSMYLIVKYKGLLRSIFSDHSRPTLDFTGMDVLESKLNNGKRQFQHKVHRLTTSASNVFDPWPKDITETSYHVISCYYPLFRASDRLFPLFERSYQQLSQGEGGVFIFTAVVADQIPSSLSDNVKDGYLSFSFESSSGQRVKYKEPIQKTIELQTLLEKAGFRFVTSVEAPTLVPESRKTLSVDEFAIFSCYRVFVCYKVPIKHSSNVSMTCKKRSYSSLLQEQDASNEPHKRQRIEERNEEKEP